MFEEQDQHKYALLWFEEFSSLIHYALSNRTGGVSDIDDLAQEVYLRLLRVPKPELVENPKSYVYRVALNVAQEWRQRPAQRLPHSSDDISALVAVESVEGNARLAERKKLIQSTLSSLPKANVTAVILHTRDGMTYEEIGVHMGVTRRAVKRYIANGYAALRESLGSLNPRDFAEADKLDSNLEREGKSYEG